MKKILLSVLGVIGLAGAASSQCSINSAPMNNCNYYGMQITAFSLNNIASNNAGCSTNGYGSFNTPVRALIMGNTYNWTASTGTGYYSLGFAIWIDLNNDGLYGTTEMLAVSNPAQTHSGTIYIPFTATPGTNRRMRIRSGYYSYITGGQACQGYLGNYGETEDYFVDIIAPPPCSGIPPASSVVGPPNGVCPNGIASLSISTTYSNFGYTYQWQSSTVSNVGPFTSIPNATTTTYNTPPVTQNTYYQAVITCTNGNGFTNAVATQVMVQGVTTSQVPYYEDFEGITKNNEWPNCSWAATSPTTVSRTYTTTMSQQRTARSGSKFASFYYSPSGSSYIYTNGIQLYAGVTYSAGLWYKTNYYAELNWSNMSIMLGTSQNSVGLTTIASTNGQATSTFYKALSNTFTVATSGIYYVAVKGTSTGGCCAYHLNWDDLSITAPCSLNTPTISMSANTTSICSGATVNLSASGADTYTWSTGENGNQIFVTPNTSTSYMVSGTNTLTGCPSSATQYVTVNQSPNVIVYATKNSVCPGQPVTLNAIGATSYQWNTSSNAQNITVTPTVATSYILIGTNNFGCTGTATQVINMLPVPSVSAISDRTEICRGESATLSGSGANTYQWMANTLFINTSQAIVSPNVSTTYTLVGTNAQGCQGSTTIMQTVAECLGLNGITTTLNGVKVYPNPTSGVFSVELRNGANKMIEVIDVTGRTIILTNTKDEVVNVNLNNLSNGIYYVKIQSNNTVEVVKVVKH